jgi:hypothetical protein
MGFESDDEPRVGEQAICDAGDAEQRHLALLVSYRRAPQLHDVSLLVDPYRNRTDN